MNRLASLDDHLAPTPAMSIHISEARVVQVREVITTWCEDFSKSLSEAEALASIQRDFDPQVEWYDHGFHICRVGHKAVLGLRMGFRHCNDPFRAEIKVSEAFVFASCISRALDLTFE